MAIGVFLYILGIRHARRSRGPRRKGLPLPVTEPIDLAVEGADKGVISSSPPTRRRSRAVAARSRSFPAVAVSALLFTGCSADSWPQLGASPTPSPTATVIVPEGQQAPAVTKAQAERIIARIAATAADADETLRRDARRDPAGRRRARRRATTNYTLRGAIADYEAPARDPDQAARDRPSAGLRRLAALGDGRRRRRGDEDVEHHGAHAGGRVVAVQALVPGEPRGVDPDARPRSGVHRRARRCRRTRRSS